MIVNTLNTTQAIRLWPLLPNVLSHNAPSIHRQRAYNRAILENHVAIMTPQLMVQPSSLMASGVQMREFGGVYLFRFSEELQSRFDALLDRQKSTALSAEERAEYAGITELQRIFTLINAQLVAKGETAHPWQRPQRITPLWQQVHPAEIAQRLRERAATYAGLTSDGLPNAAFDRETIYGD